MQEKLEYKKVLPGDYGLPHGEWRPNQHEAVEFILDNKGTVILEAPTGSGKTGISSALGSEERVVSLVRTKFLQQDNYDSNYRFDVLYGRANYKCPKLSSAFERVNADECEHKSNMTECPDFRNCDYFNHRERAKGSMRASLNYAFWLSSMGNQSWPSFDRLVMDEAHQLPDLTIEWAGITLTRKDREEYSFPLFPPIFNTRASEGKKSSGDRVLAFLSGCLAGVTTRVDSLKGVSIMTKELKKAEQMQAKIKATIEALQKGEEGWYIRSGLDAVNGEMGLVAKPLTARYHFDNYFSGDFRRLIMSATIGNYEVFAEELGISKFDFHTIPNAFTASQRPIHALDAPRMGNKSTDKDYWKQAEVIAAAINQAPGEWSGIVHTTSIRQANELGQKLHSLVKGHPVYIQERKPTNQMMNDWHEYRNRHGNPILVSWAYWEGYDGTEEKICIAAKVPYPYIGDPYEMERMKYSGKFYLQRAAWQLEQGLGRVRRGRPQDYDMGGKVNGLVAIADGNWTRVKKYISKSAVESVVTSGI